MQSTSSNRHLIVGIIGVTVLIFAGLVFAIIKAPSDTPSGSVDEKLSFQDQEDPAQGPKDANVVVRVFEDFQCPACRLAEGGFHYALEKYKDRVKFIWNDFPLTSIHPQARLGANAARCAEDQGKFWEYHDLLYAKQMEWVKESNPKSFFIDYATSLGINKETFTACVNVQAEDRKVLNDLEEGNRNNVNATPTVFINNHRYFAMTPAEWDVAIELAIKNAGSTSTNAQVTSTQK